MRNPYLLLGVDYGSSPSKARRRFALAARRLRRSPNSTIRIEDLNWALHEIQSRTDDPADDVDTFRVPADPAVFAPEATGLFAPSAVPIARATTSTPEDRGAIDDGLAAELGPLFGAVAVALARFDFGYHTADGNQV